MDFENRDPVTHLLVRGFAGRKGDDLDVEDDGVLERMSWAAVLDGVLLARAVGAGGMVYAAALGLESVGPNGRFVPGHVYRMNDTGRFGIGDFLLVGRTDTPGGI